MAKGFIYVVRTVDSSYQQPAFCNVPTQLGDRLYFGPCKKPMRPRMSLGDYVFGISPSGTMPRRIVFAAQLDERITFAEAYERFPDLRGPRGPIHVRPVSRSGSFPASKYEHIPGAMHSDDWELDLRTPELDRFFVCHPAAGWRNTWLGAHGPETDDEVVALFRECAVYGAAGRLADRSTGTRRNPVAHEGLFTGLHLETDDPERLLAMCAARLGPMPTSLGSGDPPRHRVNAGPCGPRPSTCGCEPTPVENPATPRRTC